MTVWSEATPNPVDGSQLVQNYAPANVSCWSADSTEEINKRWKREDPQSKEALEKESNLWDWLHLQGAPRHTNHLDRAHQLLHTCICLVPSERLGVKQPHVKSTCRECSGLLFHSTAVQIQLPEALSSPPALPSGPTWRQLRCAVSPQTLDGFSKSPVPCHHTREVTSAVPSQEGWPADRSHIASAWWEDR